MVEPLLSGSGANSSSLQVNKVGGKKHYIYGWDGRCLESSELTTKQAAELLGVSRPFLIVILESGAIPYRKIGRRRRVLMKDVLAYKKTMQVNRRAALDELVKASEDAGGYDL
jgi:excisionase family DNA binding protein